MRVRRGQSRTVVVIPLICSVLFLLGGCAGVGKLVEKGAKAELDTHIIKVMEENFWRIFFEGCKDRSEYGFGALLLGALYKWLETKLHLKKEKKKNGHIPSPKTEAALEETETLVQTGSEGEAGCSVGGRVLQKR